MTANVDAMVRAGVEAFRAGKKAEARTLLERALELDNYNEMAWMWLSAVVDSPEEQRTCLENVVVINPENERAKQGLRSLGVDPDAIINEGAAEEAVAEEAVVDDYSSDAASAIFTDDFSSPAPPVSESSATDDLFGDTDFSADQPFEFDDKLFAEDSYDDAYDDEGYADEDYVDEGYDDAAYIDEGYEADDESHDGDEFYADKTTLEEFSDAVSSGDMDDYDHDLFERDPFAPEPKPEPEPEAPDPQTLFSQIPKEIESRRLPGTDEEAPTMHYMIIGGLAVVNVVALIFIAVQFMG